VKLGTRLRAALLILVAALVAAAVRLVWWPDAGPAGNDTASRQTSPRSACRRNPHAGVHDPARLQVLHACATVVGTVVGGPKLNPSDADVTFTVKPEHGYKSMLNDRNRSALHIAVVPMDQPGCTRGQPIRGPVKHLGVCSGANVVFPPVGTRVRVIGPHVYDSRLGWNEIHPAWNVGFLPSGPPPPETLKLQARLTGKAVTGEGARRGSGKVAVTVTTARLCWRFTRLTGIGRPTGATLRLGRPGRAGRVLLALGAPYRPRGCVAADAGPLANRPQLYYVSVVTARHPSGAIRGQLTPAAD
jgi:hypothetical protein